MNKLLHVLFVGVLACSGSDENPADTTTLPAGETATVRTTLPGGDTAATRTARVDTATPARPAVPKASVAATVEPGSVPPVRTPSSADSTVPMTYFATVKNRTGKELGVLAVTDTGGTLTVTGRLAGLLPGVHAIHIHSVGRCSAPSFASAGTHWNPTNKEHGLDNPNGPHLGDLPNLTVPADSLVNVLARIRGATLMGETPLMDVDGAAIIIHAGADDNRSQPSGGAGNPVACGVVVVR
jgi:superoxide dismutase, Cu-Zn family